MPRCYTAFVRGNKHTFWKERAMSAVQKKKVVLAGFAVLTLCAAVFFYAPLRAYAAEAKEAVQFNAAASLADNLTALKGKPVTVTLAGGQTVSGIVKDVSAGLLHLEKLSQKEFYDALVILDKIASIEARVR
jgi:hypothetical protein